MAERQRLAAGVCGIEGGKCEDGLSAERRSRNDEEEREENERRMRISRR